MCRSREKTAIDPFPPASRYARTALPVVRPPPTITRSSRAMPETYLPAPRLLVASPDLLPVHDVPPGRQIVRSAVLVLEVVGVLPDVNPEQRRVAVRDRRVLVRRRVHGQPGAVVDEPRPAASETLDAAVVQLLL